MVFDPEHYYELYLKGKDVNAIEKEIKTLKREISRLKRTMEDPDYGIKPIMMPSEDVQIYFHRLYLEKAFQVYKEVGGNYIPTRNELRSKEFDENIPFIEKIIFESVDRVLRNSFIVRFENGKVIREILSIEGESDTFEEKQDFLDGLRELHIGEWKKNYNLSQYGIEVNGGEFWSLRITYSNDFKPQVFKGYTSYPYNFDNLKELLGIDIR